MNKDSPLKSSFFSLLPVLFSASSPTGFQGTQLKWGILWEDRAVVGSGGGEGQPGYYPSRRVEWLAPLSKHKRSGHSRTGEWPHLKNGGHQQWLALCLRMFTLQELLVSIMTYFFIFKSERLIRKLSFLDRININYHYSGRVGKCLQIIGRVSQLLTVLYHCKMKMFES